VAESVELDVLAFAAHPDDIEITGGGTLIKMAADGRRTGVCDLTRGEMGTYGDADDREAEAAEAAREMGLAFRCNLGLPDSAVEYTQANKLSLAQVVRDTRPELVILPHWRQRHPDHLACSRLGYDACFLAGLKKADLTGEPFRPRKIIFVSYFRNQDYSFLVDISDCFRQKLQAVAAYKSQFGEADPVEILENRQTVEPSAAADDSTGVDIFHPGLNIYELMYTRARQLGQLVGVWFAEAFTVREHILIDDPQKMPVRSI
jgi:bacillithiol biosynthesis deacetylase BshB1